MKLRTESHGRPGFRWILADLIDGRGYVTLSEGGEAGVCTNLPEAGGRAHSNRSPAHRNGEGQCIAEEGREVKCDFDPDLL